MDKENIHIIDANGKRIGRVATEVAHLLLGKNSVFFARNQVIPIDITVINVDSLDIDEKKKKQKEYVRYSGYPGGKKVEPLQRMIEKRGHEEVLKKAVYGMLPGNKLRSKRMKMLKIQNS